eukprot:m.13983 g.13983  ORF g.13983 m.13983 type:complete len:840 (-) comp6092_c0_seq1:58-2577(-)
MSWTSKLERRRFVLTFVTGIFVGIVLMILTTLIKSPAPCAIETHSFEHGFQVKSQQRAWQQEHDESGKWKQDHRIDAKERAKAASWHISSVHDFIIKYQDVPLATASGGPGPVRICLVTSAITGPTKNGGIATAMHALAMSMASATSLTGAPAFEVTVLYAAHPWYGEGSAERWKAEFARFSIRFVPLPSAKQKYYGAPLVVRSYNVFAYLYEHQADFDIISYHDFMGNGYFTAMAKRQGLAFATIPLVIQCHSTLRWADELNYRPPKDHNTLAYYTMEQRALEWSDVRVSPSKYYLNWFADNGINLSSGHSFVVQNLMYPLIPIVKPSTFQQAPSHFVFFGRLEIRKGILVFLEALRLLRIFLAPHKAEQPQFHELPMITFLGPSVKIAGTPSVDFVRSKMELMEWPEDKYTTITSLGSSDAMAYIAQNSAVACMPTLGDNSPYVVLEMMAQGLPFITTNAGGGQELLKQTSSNKHFVIPTNNASALALALKTALLDGITTFEPQTAFQDTTHQYLHLLKALKTRTSSVDARRHSPLVQQHKQHQYPDDPAHVLSKETGEGVDLPTFRVLIGITSHNRPEDLIRATRSIVRQMYPSTLLHVVIVDDASSVNMESAFEQVRKLAETSGMALTINQLQTHQFVGTTRNMLFQSASDGGFDYACLMDDDDEAMPRMIETYMQVAKATHADILTDFSDNYDMQDGTPVFSHRSLAVGNSFSHNFFINDYGKANFCVKPQRALSIGGHHTGPYSNSPYVDWAFLSRASLRGLSIELVPFALYKYTKHSAGSVWYTRTSRPDQYSGHRKMLEDVMEEVPEQLHDAILYCRYKLGTPSVVGDGTY